ncbi:MAG: bifunctional hydroxymethylpyrimidine kinase/phosphomethylpyrimidine kinase [Hyphomicrobiaceae bacterium]|nr:MAG: bifunctional hydroxymethylpyrimidine kinase/phosphomethylpyrimidine kinase [Hyphomicrobiaceae bacterium]
MSSPTLPMPVALTIAGSDSGGGAGIQADLKTFAALGVYGTSAITALTAQNTLGVQGVLPIEPGFIAAQIASVLADFAVGAAKTGMLGTSEAIRAVASALEAQPSLPLVVDPVMVATSGDPLIDDGAVAALIEVLLPRAAIVTPNLPEAARMTGRPAAKTEEEMREQARLVLALGAKAVLLKGGHGSGSEAVDILLDERGYARLSRPRIATRNTHGTGCTLSAAIAAGLARGLGLGPAVEAAKDYLWQALRSADRLGVGHGAGPVDHMHTWR